MRFLAPLLLAVAVSAQGGTVTLSFNQHATQNLFQTREAVADQISSFSLAFDHDISAFSLLANVEYSAFHQTAGLDFFGADLGLDYLVPSGSRSAFYFAAGGAGAFYSQAYAGFSTLGVSLIGAFKTYVAPSSILKLQWQGNYASYADRLFDHVSQVALLSIDRYFPTRTTLKADVEYGSKRFLHPFVTETGGLASPETAGPVLMASGGRGGGVGYGSGSGSGSGSGWGGRQYQSGYGFIPRAGSGGQSIGHASASILVAQGVGDILGLSASALRQWIVSGENPFLSIEEFYLVSNPSADSFSWDGHQITGRITLNLPWSVELRTGCTYSDRTYPGVDSMGLDGLPLGIVRSDTRRLIEARLEKSFRRLSVFIAYAHIANDSSDPLFAWRSGYITGGFQWNLPTARKGGGS
ncbi:MAG TPA: hypothetical protein VLJ16_05495 [Acidobacteriota bacterium]|nr:hypothetical protein [Acidobacteriota bacterium]